MATGTVKQIITFEGQDKASGVAKGVRDSLRGIGEESRKATSDAAKVAADSGKAIDTVREKSGDVESALKGISDFAGASSDQVSKLGDSFGAVEAVMRLLPGPIGLIATGIAGAALGAKLLSDALSQTAAKERLIVSGAASQLAENLKLGTEGAQKLTAALADLEGQTRPSDALLRQVAENAKAMGAEPAENVAKFIAAWREGPDAVRKVQVEIGRLRADFVSLPDAAKLLGLDAVELGLEAASTAQSRLTEALREYSRLRSEVQTQEQVVESAANRYTISRLDSDMKILINETVKLQALEARKKKQDELAKQNADEINATARLAEVESSRNAQAQIAEIRAQLALSKEEAQRIRVQSIADQQKSIEEDIVSLLGLQVLFGDAFAKGKLDALKLSNLQLEVLKKQMADAGAAEKRAQASAAAAAARQRRQAADASAERERERAHQEWRNGVEATKREEERLRQQGVRERAAELALEGARIEQIAAGEIKAERQVALIKKKAAEDIANLQADESLNRRARALETQRIEIEAENAVAAVRKTEAKRKKDVSDKEVADLKLRAQSLFDIVTPATEAARAIGGQNGLSGALASAVEQGRKLVNTWSDTESNASGIIGAVGNVAAAVVEGEKEKAAILGVMEAAQAIALAFVPGKQPEAAAHAAAALMYGGIATGLIGGSSSSAGAPAAGGGQFAQQSFGAPVAGEPVAMGTTVINFNAPLATRYEIGKDVVAAQKAAKAWAKAPAGV